MRRFFHFLVSALPVVLMMSGCSRDAGTASIEPLPPIDAAAVSELLASSESPVVINVWASWCIPCRSEAPLLRRAVEEFGDRVRFIGINVSDTQDGARAFLSEFDLPFEHHFDPSRSVPAALGGSGVPLTYFFAGGGRLVHYQPGVIDERTLALQIDEVLRR